MPTISQSFLSIRQQIASDLGDLVATFTAASGSTTGCTATGRIAALPAGSLIGAEISCTSGTGLGQSTQITSHTVSSGTVTLGWPTMTALSTDSVCEIHKLATKKQYDDHIYSAVDEMADRTWTDTDIITLAAERGNGGVQGLRRNEYPLPTSLNWLYGVDYLSAGPSTVHSIGYLQTQRAFGDDAARTRLSQGFQVPSDGLYAYISFYMGKVGSPTDNLTCVVETNSSGVPSTTAVTNGTSDIYVASGLQERMRYVVFTFDPPMRLDASTQYHATLRRSATVSSSNYMTLGEDDANGYANGALSLYDASNWAAVTGSDLLFSVCAQAPWVRLTKANWRYSPQAVDALVLSKLPSEGVPLRLRGGTAIARPTAETGEIPVRPDWVLSRAKIMLLKSLGSRLTPEPALAGAQAHVQELGMRPLPYRLPPADAVRIQA